MTKSSTVVVCDAGPLIHLDELGRINLLSDFQRVLIPDQVWDEVNFHRPNIETQSNLSFEKVKVPVSSKTSFQTLVRTLGND